MNSDFWSPVILSVQIAICSTIIVFIIGTMTGRWMAQTTVKWRSVMETVFLLPLVLPPSVVGFLLIVIFGANSPVGQAITRFFGQPLMFTWWAGLLAAIVVSFPLMYQSAKAGFSGVDRGVEEAARVDGAKEWQLFLFITLPLTMKALLAGVVLSFARALGEFGATLMFAGNIPGKTQTTATAIYVAMDSGALDLAWKWVFVLVTLSFLLIFLLQKIR